MHGCLEGMLDFVKVSVHKLNAHALPLLNQHITVLSVSHMHSHCAQSVWTPKKRGGGRLGSAQAVHVDRVHDAQYTGLTVRRPCPLKYTWNVN